MHSQRLYAFSIVVISLFSLNTMATRILLDDNLTARSSITLNGKNTRVYFNDGDTFKILSGKFKNKSVRVRGFNTLENYGRVHKWADIAASELNEVATESAELARQGGWHCTIQKGSDRYGRKLADCHDLGLALIEKGFAHAYSIDETPAEATFLRAQRLAQKNRLGMWSGGVPRMIITSLHSATEEKGAYNRLISTKDGHSEMQFHRDIYAICETICLGDEFSCMVHVPFQMRYGTSRPGCLQDEGEMCRENRVKNEPISESSIDAELDGESESEEEWELEE